MNPWIIIAEEVLKSVYDEADDSTIESIVIGLKGQTDPKCKQALQAILDFHKKKHPNQRGRKKK